MSFFLDQHNEVNPTARQTGSAENTRSYRGYVEGALAGSRGFPDLTGEGSHAEDGARRRWRRGHGW